MTGELYDSPTALAIGRALPLEARVSTWGEEIYFTIPVQADLDETAKEVVDFGDIGYWPHGERFVPVFRSDTNKPPGRNTPCQRG